ncbi:phage terminase small subunit P27 family [Arthrospiribacter ruber]|uniref:Phage terminase small subunit P27 family n=1 Tax=Arthrospiribacter ruber TaxID=2487934 RepID=A0A951MC82_9BACT|nr:phage terminase small subunit P27 family [Arthrospiribacter ruber]MBW3469091.1 phage terminase small subunit P27 family [Arthrospiribacter ruber]
MGRNTLPDEIKANRGTLRKHRVNTDKPEPNKVNKSSLKIPAHLNKYAKAFYSKYFEMLTDYKVLTDMDLDTLEVLSSEYGKYIEAQYKIKSEGYMTVGTNKNGSTYSMVSPWVNIANNAFKNYSSLMAKFGLSPSERAKVSVIKDEEPKQDEVKIEDFLN